MHNNENMVARLLNNNLEFAMPMLFQEGRKHSL